MKIRAFYITTLAILVLSTNLSGDYENRAIKSVVYDFEISENELSGYCFIIGDEIGRISKYIELNSGFKIVEESTDELILKIENRTVDNEFTLPMLSIPYKTEKTLIGITAAKKEKLVWKTPIKTKDGDDDKVLVEEGFDGSKLEQLNENFRYLREKISEDKTAAEYRFYLGESNPNEKIKIEVWVGNAYEYYLPNSFIAIVICMGLFLFFYFIVLKKV